MVIKSVRLPEDLVERVGGACERHDRSFSWVVRTALEQYLKLDSKPDSKPDSKLAPDPRDWPKPAAPAKPYIGRREFADSEDSEDSEPKELPELPERFRPVPPVPEIALYMCPEERCFQTATKPGVCPSHRSKRMVRA